MTSAEVLEFWSVAKHAEDPLLRRAFSNKQLTIPYARYLETSWWRYRRRIAYAVADHRCQRCGKPARLEAHHVTYRYLWMEPHMDLLALCSTCHHKETFSTIPPQRAPTRIEIPPLIIRYLRSR